MEIEVPKRSREYWSKRFEILKIADENRALRKVDEISEYYDRTKLDIEKQINHWYQRLAVNNKISISEAKKLLSKKELKEFKWSVQDYIKYGEKNAIDPLWMKELENASAKFHISRLEALKISARQEIEALAGKQEEELTSYLDKKIVDDYLHTAYELQKGTGFGFTVHKPSTSKVRDILSKPWTTDNRTFSDRIWFNKSRLIHEVDQELSLIALAGKAPDRAIANISSRFGVSKRQAGRLVMTENAYFSERAHQACFSDLGVKEYEIVSTLDSKTSEICRSLDGKHFPMSEFKPGITAPPFHPWCRTTSMPYFDDEFTKGEMRAARDEYGKTYYVPADMNYREWEEKYVLSSPLERKIQDREMANGLRRSYYLTLSDDDKKEVLDAIDRIKADKEVFEFRDGKPTAYYDDFDIIYVSSNAFPSNDDSRNPRDRMSLAAALAHEYYGHRAFRHTNLSPGSWQDEFRASYFAAKNAPGLSDRDKIYLIQDAMLRAREAGVSIKLNKFMKEVLYGS